MCTDNAETASNWAQRTAIATHAAADVHSMRGDAVDEKALLAGLRAGQLPENYRAVLILRDIEELSTREVAEMLTMTPTAVKVRLHRARQALSTLLRKEYARPTVTS
jgi:RNA polymerase sigma factor (sigma-70 family)